jgi:hypothetical protein
MKSTVSKNSNKYLIVFFCTLFIPLALLLGAIAINENDEIIFHSLIPFTAPSEDYYTRTDISWDQKVFLDDFSPTVKNIKKADVLIIGNSQAIYNFHGELLQDFFARHKLRFFNLSLEGTKTNYFLDIMDKHNIVPKMLILIMDNTMVMLSKRSVDHKATFSDNLSFKDLLRIRLRNHIWLAARKISPQFIYDQFSSLGPNLWALGYRSSQNGIALVEGHVFRQDVVYFKEQSFESDCENDPNRNILNPARQLRKKYPPSITEMVFTITSGDCMKNTENIAEELRTSFINVDWRTINGIAQHLVFKSNKLRFTEIFLKELEQTNEFKRLVAKVSQP